MATNQKFRYILNNFFNKIRILFLIIFIGIITFFLLNSLQISNKFNYSGYEYRYVEADSAYTLWLKNKALFIDARPAIIYNQKHIKNAVSIACTPNISLEILEGSEVKEIRKDRLIVVYCDSKDCNLSLILYGLLHEIGFRNIFILEGGIHEWHTNNFPVDGLYKNDIVKEY